MDLRSREHLPIVWGHGGRNSYALAEFSEITAESYTHSRTGVRCDFLEQLKKCCLHSPSGVVEAFSNLTLHLDLRLTIGRIIQIKVPETYKGKKLVLLSAPNYASVQGDVSRGEAVFPHLQFVGTNQINVTCSAFEQCPAEYSPDFRGEVCLGIASTDVAEQLMQKAVWEYSQNHSNMAIILLYAAIETAVLILTEADRGRVSVLINEICDRLKEDTLKSRLRRLKRKIEEIVVRQRGRIAHQGLDVNPFDIQRSFETALEFFWYYEEFKADLGS